MYKIYKRIKDSLLSPREISSYVDDKIYKLFAYLFVMLLLMLVPTLINLYNTQEVSTEMEESLVSSLQANETINYAITNKQLNTTTSDIGAKVINGKVNAGLFIIDSVTVFDSSEKNEQEVLESLDINVGSCFLLLFTKNEIRLYFVLEDTISKSNSSNLGAVKLFAQTYEKMNINNVNFSLKDSNFSLLSSQIKSLCTNLYKSLYKKNIVLIVIVVLTVLITNYFTNIIVITLLEKIIYRFLRLSFGKVLVITMLCSTPYIIATILSIAFNIMFIQYIGLLIMILYTVRTMGYYIVRMNIDKNNNKQDNNI